MLSKAHPHPEERSTGASRRTRSPAQSIGLIGLICFHLQRAAAQPAEQLDRLVAPIALYPDPVLAQVLMVATYPESAHPRFLQILSELGPLEDR